MGPFFEKTTDVLNAVPCVLIFCLEIKTRKQRPFLDILRKLSPITAPGRCRAGIIAFYQNLRGCQKNVSFFWLAPLRLFVADIGNRLPNMLELLYGNHREITRLKGDKNLRAGHRAHRGTPGGR